MTALIVLQGCRTVQLTKGLNTLIDEGDFETVGRRKWYAHETRYAFYAARREAGAGAEGGVFLYLHRVVVEAATGTDVDHRNGDCLDNRRENLRASTHAENLRNQRRTCGSSRFKGVVLMKGPRPWSASLILNRRKIHLGRHATEEGAARAYDAGARQHFGEYACTNADLFGAY